MTRAVTADAGGIELSVDLLRVGECVALPTETVYGLAADARNPDAVAKIFAAKGRPAINPVIVHVTDVAAALELIELNDTAKALAARFWPGPLTLVAPMREGTGIAASVTAGLATLAVRAPSHPVFRRVLELCGFPLAAPSANASGRLTATSPQIVAQGLKDKIPLILAAGLTDKGVESTVLDVSEDTPVLLRHGALPIEAIEDVIGPVRDGTQGGDKPKSPGQFLRHYAPRLPLRLDAVDVAPGEALLAFGDLKFMGQRGGGWAKDLPSTHLKNLSEGGDLDEAAHHLFAHLYALDQSDAVGIAVMPIPTMGIGRAIGDRLRRACLAQQTD